MPRVAIMGRSVRPHPTGVGRYAANLIRGVGRALPPRAVSVFLTRDAPSRWSRNVHEVRAPFPTPNEYARAFWEQTVVPAQVAQLGIDVYHSPNYILPAALTCPSVVTIHDLAYLQPRLHRLRSHVYLTVLTSLALRRATAVVAVSDYTRRRVEAQYPHTRGRVVVISEGVDEALQPPDQTTLDAFRTRAGLAVPYVLFVGTQEPRKNLVRLVEAFETVVCRTGLPHHLMLVGPQGWKTSALDLTIALSPLQERIHQVGYVSDADLACWYAGADVFVYPSLDEGFGLPVLEAMACGAPVITSDRASLPEVAGDAAIAADPEHSEALVSALMNVLLDGDLAARLRAAGRRRVTRFSWDAVARRHAELYQRVALGRRDFGEVALTGTPTVAGPRSGVVEQHDALGAHR